MHAHDKLARLRKALERGRLDFDAIVEKARKGEVQFHETDGAVAVTALYVSGEYRTCYVVAIAGELSEVPLIGAQLEAYAREMRCDTIETDGRIGFKKLHERLGQFLGWKPVAVKYRKDLQDGRRAVSTDHDNSNPENGAAGMG